MSATAESSKLLNFFRDFNPACVEFDGRPQIIHEVFLDQSETQHSLETIILGMLGKILFGNLSGDILIFLSGEKSIRQVHDQIKGLLREEKYKERAGLVELNMLFKDLPLPEQQQVSKDMYNSEGERFRKIILATNLDETSITLPHLVFVIDSGQNNMPLFNFEYRGVELREVPNSKAQADQRRGRVGRVQVGYWMPCFTEEDYKNLVPAAPDALSRADLTLPLLKVLSLPSVDGHLERFPWFSEFDPCSPSCR